ncbi:MAG: STAS domain-containing protein [Leptospiraceae bacterium]|nr:STAS domain-containing protein [Leptospiraceae bacterium]
MDIKKSQEGSIFVLTISGSIQHGDTPIFEEGIERTFNDGARFIVLDFKDLRYICSSALGVLIASKRKIRRREGDIRIVLTEGDVLRVFRITLLDRVFQFFDDLASAVKSFGDAAREA